MTINGPSTPFPEEPAHNTTPSSSSRSDLSVVSKEELSEAEAKSAIENIHASIGWEHNTKLSLIRLAESVNRTFFLTRNTGETKEILGYLTAKPVYLIPTLTTEDSNDTQGTKAYYVSFLAVQQKEQSKGGGKALMTRIFEEATKKQAAVILDHKDTPKLTRFYDSFRPSTIRHGGHYMTGEAKRVITYRYPANK